MNPYVCKTAKQKAARRAFEALIADPGRADPQYDSLEAADGGRIVSTDLARWLDPLYAKTPTSGRHRDLAPSWNAAWKYAQGRLERELRSRGKRKQVAFMSGGWGAGKTHTLEKLPHEKRLFDLAWDGTLADWKWAARMILLALKDGWRVTVYHVHRNAELALYGAIEREAREGRGVPLRELSCNHRQVQRSVLNLMRRFHAEARVSFVLLHNTGTSSVPGRALEIVPKDLAPRGGLYYSLSHQLYYSHAAPEIHDAS